MSLNGANGFSVTGETVYLNVRHKKSEDTLTLTANLLCFSNLLSIPWSDIAKHQVSPVSYPKSLLKIILRNGTALTFQLSSRADLETIRNDVMLRLRGCQPATPATTTSTNKRSHSISFGQLDATALAVTRSSLLAANPTLRNQHSFLVKETQTLSEADFWQTHQSQVQDEYARISGMAKAGASSLLQSHVPSSGRVTLGVEEMRQIFILYPAVHKAYEEKVPLELSDEQFWRKYLESEYFHRDRGRVGMTARNMSQETTTTNNSKKNTTGGPSLEQQDARAAAVGADDLFSRYDQKLKEQHQQQSENGVDERHPHRHWGRLLAVGQFDLASTFETERGNLLQGPQDNHPPNPADDGKGARVIQKYNRHWAMVLHPDEAVAGCDLKEVARQSVRDVLPGDQDAWAGGGLDEEMRRLVDFASAMEEEADHAAGVGHHEEYERLTLSNVEAYYSGQIASKNESKASSDDTAKRHAVFAKAMATKMDAMVRSIDKGTSLPLSCFPPAALGRELLSALTKKMAQDSKTEEASLELVNRLPESFRKKLQSYFCRSSELLRHFFGLRKLEAQRQGNSQKLARIVLGMETFYREMETMRKDLPQTETGETMRKMCLPIMDQLDWAFKLHREGNGGGGAGGFVDVEEN
jgi:transcription initiation factor TFIIH subunit 1